MLLPSHRFPIPALPPQRPSASDSDSDYGGRARKKRRSGPRPNGHGGSHEPDVRLNSRGSKVPNYREDAEDMSMFYEDDQAFYHPEADYGQYEEDHEIEAVLTHMRDEGRENDPEDVWHDNIVSVAIVLGMMSLTLLDSVSTSNGKVFLIFTTQTKRTSS